MTQVHLLFCTFAFLFMPKLAFSVPSSCGIEGCIDCDEFYGCYTCTDGYIDSENPNYGVDDDFYMICVKCHESCKTCETDYDQNGDECTSCHEGFYLDKKRCKPCPTQNCYKCDGDNNKDHACLQCKPGYTFFENECKSCHTTCSECSGPEDYQCTKCAEGYVIYSPSEDKKYCYQCDPNCKVCQTFDKCSQCKEGYYEMSGKCYQCHSSCKNCKGEGITNCTECKESSYFYGNQCRACDPNCKTCKGMRNLCTSCFEGQYINDKHFCVDCDRENCKKCEGPGQCTTCADGYYKETNGICTECGPKKHCKTCRKDRQTIDCTECADNAYVIQDYTDGTYRCELCPINCSTCSDGKICTSCKEGFFLKVANCEKCDDGCSSCVDTPTFCTSCYTGYVFNNASNSCMKCPDGCSQCDVQLNCKTCSDGFFLKENSCIKCNDSCSKCSDETNACQECAPGYTFNAFRRCTKCPANCTLCDETGCIDCDPEFYLLKDGNCAPCSDVCYECNGPTENDCIECDPGLYYDHKLKQCVECDPACSTCNGPRDRNCLECATGFYHTERLDIETSEYYEICGPCEYGCAECTDDDICTVCKDGFRIYDGESTPDCEPCDTGCKRCNEAKDKCTECLDTFYQSSINGNFVTCSSCPSNCKTCSKDINNKVTCIDCIDGFYIKNGKCIQCNSPCATCSSATKCTSCIAGHLFDGIDSCSSQCSPECLTCERTQTTCITCHSGFYLVNNSCIECNIEGCKKCIIGEHSSTCRECIDGYYKDSYYDGCTKCPKGCATCDEGNYALCLTCAPEYYEKSKKSNYVECSSCTETDEKCSQCIAKCDENKQNCLIQCTKCKEGYSLNQNYECIQCHSSCKTCNGESENECISCNDKFFLNAAKQCEQCSDSCENCEGTSSTCTSCKSHQYVNNGKCTDCDSSCLDCSGSSTNCISCPENKFLYNGLCYDTCDEIGTGYGPNENRECIKCNIYHCLNYDEACQCQKCEEGFYVVSDPITLIEICLPCGVENCRECNGSGNDDCSLCSDGFFLNTDPNTGFKSCLPCIGNCELCTYNALCTKCKEGYFLNEDYQCQLCNSPCVSCSGTDGKTCEKCIEGYYMIEGSCLPCKSPCTTCNQSDTDCLSCEVGYYYKDSRCTECPTNCNECENENVCKKCSDGFYLLNNKCDTCDSSCSTCSSKSICTSCPSGTYLASDNKCYSCDPACLTCNGAGSFQCTSCHDGFYSFYGSCTKCDQSCKTCDGYAPFQCLSCNGGYYYSDEGNNFRYCRQCETKHCEICDLNDKKVSICTKCKPPFELIDGVCVGDEIETSTNVENIFSLSSEVNNPNNGDNDSNSSKKESKKNVGLIVGIVIVAVIAVVAIVLLIVIILRRNPNKPPIGKTDDISGEIGNNTNFDTSEASSINHLSINANANDSKINEDPFMNG